MTSYGKASRIYKKTIQICTALFVHISLKYKINECGIEDFNKIRHVICFLFIFAVLEELKTKGMETNLK